MHITLNVPTPPHFIHSVLFDKLRGELLTIDIRLGAATVTSYADGVAVINAVVYPAPNLNEAEVPSRAQELIDATALAAK